MPSNTNTLRAGEALTPGQKLRSADGRFELVYQSDGNLVLYDDGRVVWHANTDDKPPGRVAMQTDGHLVIYGPNNAVHWKTGVYGFADGRLVLENDGALTVLGKEVWGVRPNLGPPPAPPAPVSGSYRNVLRPGDPLTPGQKLQSTNGRFELRYQPDGNLVLYDAGRVAWHSKTNGKAAGQAAIQTDGLLCLISPLGANYWHDGAFGFTGRLMLDDDGALLVLRQMWCVNRVAPPATATLTTLLPGHSLTPGQKLQSANRRFELVYQSDGNLGLYDLGRAVWHARMNGRPAGRAVLEADGRICLYGPDNAQYWRTAAYPLGECRLVLDDDGALAVIGAEAWSIRNQPAGNLDPAGGPPPEAVAVGSTLGPGERLTPGQKLQSPNGRFELIYQSDGNLVVYDAGRAVWHSRTAQTSAGAAVMQANGHFLLFTSDESIAWYTNVHGFTGRLVVGDDGSVFVRREGWSANRPGSDAPPADNLRPGEALYPGDKLRSLNARFSLVYQLDGNLALYDGERVAWQARTTGKPAGEVTLQANSFAVSGPGSVVHWDVAVPGLDSGRLMLDDDGAMFLLTAAWSLGPQTRFEPNGGRPPPAVNMGNTLRPGEKLTAGQKLQSANGHYELIYQTDSNLVLYAFGRPVWSTNTNFGSPGETVMALDGQLLVNRAVAFRDGQGWFFIPANVWSSKVSGFRGRLVLGEDGVLTVFREAWQFPRNLDTLSTGQALTPGNKLQSPNGQLELGYQADGNLVLRNAGRVVWHTRTGQPAGAAAMQADGELCLVGPDDVSYWGTKIKGFENGKLLLRDDGTLSVLRANNTVAWKIRTAASNTLAPGDVLYPGELRRSDNGRFDLVYQTDGNLVIYEGNRLAWETGTSGKAAGKAALQPDGELRLYSPTNVVYWTNAAGGLGGTRLVLRDDGAAVLLRADQKILWKARLAFNNILRAGDALTPGMSRQSPDRSHELVYQGDGNLALYKRIGLRSQENPCKWHSNTSGRPAGAAVLRADGRLVLCGPNHAGGTTNVYWSCETDASSTWIGGDEGARGDGTLVLADDGGLDLLWAGRDVWTNNVVPTALYSGAALSPGQRIHDGKHTWTMIYQDDGELVVYNRGVYMWGSGTRDQPAGRALMQTDGILGLYTPGDVCYWQMGPPGYFGSALLIDPAMGRPGLYKSPTGLYFVQPAQPRGHMLLPGQTLKRGESLRSPNGEWLLEFDSSGMLGLFQGRSRVWDVGTVGPAAMLTSTGEFVLLASQDPPVIGSWRCRASAGPGGRLELMDDGLLVLSNPDGMVWSARAGDTRSGVIGLRPRNT